MDLQLEVMVVTSIKRRKPWPRFCWLGQEKEAVFVLDDTRISEINMMSGRTKRKTPKLQPLLPRVLTMATSQNGVWLAGLLFSGEFFLWNKDRDFIKTVAPVPAVCEMVAAARDRSVSLSLLVSGDGQRLLLVALTVQAFLWECVDPRGLGGLRDGEVKGRWAEILAPESSSLPLPADKEACLHGAFIQGEAVGDCCLCAFTFISGDQLSVTFMKIRWEEAPECQLSPLGYSVRWATQVYPLSGLLPPCRPVKSRGALLCVLSPDGLLLAVVLNQRDPRATQVLFISTQNLVSVPSWLGGCGSRDLVIPAKYVRSYWVGDVSWSAGGLYLACVLKRGSLLLLARLGGLLSLSTSGCSVEFGPAHFLPLHPLVSYRPPLPQDGSPPSSCASAQDVLRQRYSVSWHPRLACLIVSDGYTATVLHVPRPSSPASLIGALLLDATEALEAFRQAAASSQGAEVRVQLESLSTLKLTSSLQELRQGDTLPSDLPRFLQGDGLTCDPGESYRPGQMPAEEDSDDEVSQLPGPCSEAEGRLEFASMFDTLHAYPDQSHDLGEVEPEAPPLLVKLSHARKSLLMAWALGVSLGGAVEQRVRLLRYAVSCAMRYAALLHIAPFPASRGAEILQDTWLARVLHLLRTLFSLLSWDTPCVGGTSCLGVAVELTEQMVHMVLSPEGGSAAPSSHTLSTALQVLSLASQSLDQTYWLPQRSCYSLLVHQGDPGHSVPLDVFSVPLLREEVEERDHFLRFSQNAQLVGRQPSKRLLRVWQNLYTTAQQYADEMCSLKGHHICEEERQHVNDVLSQVHQVLQAAGSRLDGGPSLLRVTGEQHFLNGSYADGIQVWAAELLAQRDGGPRSCFLETRYCLALLYGLLFQYQLKEAQGFCDQLVHRLLRKAGLEDDEQAHSGDALPTARLLQVNCEAIYAVVQSLGRFMAAYFTNQALVIMPPHCVEVLPPLHFPPARDRRLVPLCQRSVTEAVRSQELSGVWTVGYALDLLLLGGLLPEAVWLARRLGDWKTAVSLGLAYATFCRDRIILTGLQWKELHMAKELTPGSILQEQLESVLGIDGPCGTDGEAYESITGYPEEDGNLVRNSARDLLRAAAVAGLDVLSQPLRRLTDHTRALASCLPGLVPTGVYLPAPPLYCPQPALDANESVADGLQASEQQSRLQVSAVLQRALLLLRAARCCLPAAQWYMAQLHRCRRVLRKIRQKCPETAVKSFPDGLKKFLSPDGFFMPRKGCHGDRLNHSVVVEMITCFRELCSLCWMLHVRDQLSVSCRKYQAARNHGTGPKVEACCMDALCWACRLLPFSRFLNAEELLQDVVLSLVSALPPVPMVAQVLSRAFPEQEDSVRVPLREKFSSLLHRLQGCMLPEREESMTALIQEQLRWSRRDRRRVAKYLAPLQRHLWEKEEDDEVASGPSRSCSTLTDGDTGDLDSEPLEPRVGGLHRNSTEQPEPREDAPGLAGGRTPRAGTPGSLALPSVGTWEFELDDDEYLSFLVLFLSYVLEKDGGEGESLDPPLLSSYAPQLQKSELHSLTFDMTTTLRRRCVRDRKGAAVFRPGCCYQLSPYAQHPHSSQVPTASVDSLVPLFPGLDVGKSQGLFGLHNKAKKSAECTDPGPRSSSAAFLSQRASLWVPQADRWLFEVRPSADVDLLQDLDPNLEAQFQGLSRLLEWMMRWSDRKVLFPDPSQKKEAVAIGDTRGVFIRVKTSAPAVLSALKLLEIRYSAALLGTHIQMRHELPFSHSVPLTEAPVFSVLQPEKGWKPKKRRSKDNSARSPLMLPDLDTQLGKFSGLSVMEEEEPGAGHAERGLSRLCHDNSMTSDLSMAEEDDGSIAEPSVTLQSLHDPDISILGTPLPEDQTLTLADLDRDTPRVEAGRGSPRTFCRADDSESSEGSGTSCGTSAAERHGSEAGVETHGLSGPGPRSSASPESLPPPGPQPGPRVQASSARGGPDLEPQRSAIVTQMLQDELFRLVQLQQVNFMGLMQIVGMSFTNLPQAQPNLPLNLPQAQPNLPLNLPQAQPNLPLNLPNFSPIPAHCQLPLPTIPHPNQPVMSEPSPSILPQPSLSVLPQCPTPLFQHSVASSQPVAQVTDEDISAMGAQPSENQQPVQDPPVHADWSQTTQMGQHDFIQASYGLLSTVIGQAPVGIPLLSRDGPSADKPPEHTAITAPPAGLRLLQLHSLKLPLLRLQPAVASPSSHPPAPSVREVWGPSISRQEPAVPKLLPVDRTPPGLVSWSSQPKPRPSDWGAEPHKHGLSHILPLLRFHAKAPPTPTCPPTPSAAFPGLGIQLLRTDPEFRVKVERSPYRPMPTPCLIPLDKLTAGPHGSSGQLQLLTVDRRVPANTALDTTPSSRKRQKRREDKKRERGIVGCTFKPEDSIVICPAEVCPQPSEEAQSEVALQQLTEPHLLACDPALTGQDLVAKVWSTAAELHAFASSQKAAPELQDACTSTDPVSPRSLADKAVSAKLPASLTTNSDTGEERWEAAVVPPDIFLDLRFPQEPPHHGPETQESPAQAEKKGGRRDFINVIDLEDMALMGDLPPRQVPHVPDGSCSPPPSSQLHLLAASVMNGTLAELPITASPVMEAPPTKGPLVGLAPPAVPQDVATVSQAGEVTMEVKPPAGRDIRVWGQMDRRAMSRSQMRSRLSEMDAQLNALQSIADHMDQEFASTRMLVRTIDKLVPFSCDPLLDLDTEPSNTVTGGVSRASRIPSPADLVEDHHQDHGSKSSFTTPALSSVGPRKRFLCTPPSAAVDSTTLLSPPSLHDLSGVATGPGRRAEDSLELSGLSDVADILSDLLRDGAMSISALGLTPAQAAKLSRQGAPQASQTEEERQELRTWMRRKQRERLAEYRRQREEQMEQERQPFKTSAASKPTSRDIILSQKAKEKKDKATLLQHHSLRTREACSLMAELLAASQALPISSLAPPPAQSSSSTRAGLQSRSKSSGRAGRSRKSPVGLRSLSSPGRLPEAQDSRASRLGLHRPAKALPSDRLSQVTRRGMLTRTREIPGVQAVVRGRPRQASRPRSVETAGGERRPSNGPMEMEERDVLSPWDPPPEIRQLLELESQGWGQGLWRDTGAELDSSSESTGSILSKLDWTAVDHLVAGEGWV